jgi:hypothetical protein
MERLYDDFVQSITRREMTAVEWADRDRSSR